MRSVEESKTIFLRNLIHYNKNNFERFKKAVNKETPAVDVYKAATSLVTRYFIWVEQNPDQLAEDEVNQMFYILHLDEILETISQFPMIPTDKLREIIRSIFY